jgi:hypothetical protein
MSEVRLHLLLRSRTEAANNRKDILRFIRPRLLDIAQRTYEKSYPITGLDESLGLHEVEAPRISRHSANEGGKVVSSRHRVPLPPVYTPGTHFCQRLSRPQGHSAAGSISQSKIPMASSGIERESYVFT